MGPFFGDTALTRPVNGENAPWVIQEKLDLDPFVSRADIKTQSDP